MQNYGFATRAIHAGQDPDTATGAVIVPIYQTSTFAQEDIGIHKGYEYARSGNPTRTALETAIAALENGAYGLTFASGLAAETSALLALLKSGDHVLCGDDVYGGTYRLFKHVFNDKGINVSFVDTSHTDEVAAALCPETRLVWLETPTNPWLKLADIAPIASLCRNQGILTLVDNTFASPACQRPLELGADIVLHSTTKYLGGHSDVVGGAIVTSNQTLYERLKFVQNAAGGVPGPFDSWLVLRGIKTLALRMHQHSENALVVAQFLQHHSAIEQVFYPGLPSHPQHQLAQRQMHGYSGMVSCTLHNGETAARTMVRRTRLFTLAESLGGVESLIELPAAMTHMSVADSTLAVPPGLVRLSVGIEDVSDLIADLEQALQGLS